MMIRAPPRLTADREPASPPRGEEMSPLFMDSGYEPNSPGSLSAEDSHSNTPGSEREGEGPQTGTRGRKRQEKNRDAARKSRRKQTERADELHEELQGLERSNSALHKEIAALKKEFHLYTTALERHRPFCCLQGSEPSPSPSSSSVSPQAGSSPAPLATASASTPASAPSLSTSSASGLTLQTHPSSSTPAPTATTLAPSTEAFTSPRSMSVPYSASFTTAVAPHSLFCTSLVSNPVPSGSPATAAQSQSRPGAAHKLLSVPAKTCFPSGHPDLLEDLLMKDAPFLTASSIAVPPPPYNHLAAKNAGLGTRGAPVDVPQPRPGHFIGNPINSSPPSSLLPSTLEDPALHSSYGGPIASSPSSLLSLLTVPSPLSVPQTTSANCDRPPPQPVPSLPPLGEFSRDLTLSELLESNDWILQ